jgi:hypothetical protein
LLDLAGRFDEARARFSDNVVRFRDMLAIEGSHARTPDAFGQLASAWSEWVDFGRRCGAFDESTARSLNERATAALFGSITEQIEQIGDEDPARRFLGALFAGLRSGAFHVVDARSQQTPPPDLSRWGWKTRETMTRRDDGSSTTYEEVPRGQTIGYVDSDADELWLIPEAALQAVRRFDPEASPHTERTTGRHLDAAGLLKREGSQQTTKARRSLSGSDKRAWFWVVRLEQLPGGEE